MPDKNNEIIETLIKILPGLAAGLCIKVGIMIKNMEATTVRIVGGVISGAGACFAFGAIFIEKMPPHYASASIAIVAMTAEQIGTWIIHKFNIDTLLQSAADYLIQRFKK